MAVEPEPAVVATVRSFLELFGRRDYDEAVTMLDEDVLLVPAGSQSPIRGRSGVRAWMEPDVFAHPAIEPLEFEAAADKVLANVRGRTMGVASGIELDWQGWAVVTVGANSLLKRIEFYLAHEGAAARAAAGLSAGSASEPAAPG